MQRISRRTFLGNASLAIGATAGAFAGNRQGDCPLRVRSDIHSLSSCQLASLRRGVAVMKARPATDPTSWQFQANIHGTVGTPTNPLFAKCEHGTIHFLTWHRAYLYFFERILRNASGDCSLNLPFWNWTKSPTLPLPFREPASGANPLFDGTRNINDGSALPDNVVVDDLNTAMNFVTFFGGSNSFSRSLDRTPHGNVHVLVGGRMGSVPTSANDPIFWLHHGNVDRLWDVWLNRGGGRQNPGDAAFLNKRYSFADECGRTVTIKVRDILHSRCLGYCYEGVASPAPHAVASAPSKVETGRVAASSLAGARGLAHPKTSQPVALTFATHRAKLARIAARAKLLKTAKARRFVLDIQGIEYKAVPMFTYAVYLNLPAGETDAETMKRHYVSSLNFFHDHKHHAGKMMKDMPAHHTQSFDVTRVIDRLQKTGRGLPADLSVTLVPVTVVASKGQQASVTRRAKDSAAKAQVFYRRIALRVVE